MNDKAAQVEIFNDLYQKACLFSDETSEKSDKKEDIDLRISMLFIKYAKMHNSSGKFAQVFEEATLIKECEKYLMGVGNACYFDYMLTDHRNKVMLYKTLQDALRLYEKHYEAVMLRREDDTFLDKIQTDYDRDRKKITDDIQELAKDLDTDKKNLSNLGFTLSRIRRIERKQLKELIEKREDEIVRLNARLNTFEQEYRKHNNTYYKYMEKMGVEDESKISEYFFASHDEAFEEIHGMSNVFEADRNWLVKKLEDAKYLINADKDTSDRLEGCSIKLESTVILARKKM